MKLEISSIRRITTSDPEYLIVKVSQKNDTESGYTDIVFEIEIKDVDFMSMTISEIESIAISRANDVLA